jgi:hypothetical protein
MIGIVAAAAILVVAGAALAWLLTRPPSPEAVADDYLRALSEGDVARIESLFTEGGLSPAAEAAFSGASGYISDYSLDLEDGGSGARTARAEVTLGGGPAIVEFVLTEQDGRWKVGPGALADVTIQTSIGDSVRIGGALVPAARPVALLPAVYPVTAAPAGLITGESSAVVTNEQPVTVAVDATLSPDAAPAAQEQLDAYADACARPADTVPEHCGLRVPWGADLATLSSIAFRIDAYPAIALAADGSTFAATGGDIVATATGTTRDGGAGTFTYRADDWALRGSVTFTGDEMVLAVR